ncbi:hypothetical protein SF1_11810 [Sphingobacterium faecium NBRC 15299]|nr:hypothetical protein SF1_11810 [Sphingobacterium faecium NBRC 15299]
MSAKSRGIAYTIYCEQLYLSIFILNSIEMKYIFFGLSISILMSCSEANQDKPLEQLDKKSAREVVLVTETKGDSVLHITKQHIWFNGEKIADKSDTIITAKRVNTWSVGDTAQTLSEVPIYVTVQ